MADEIFRLLSCTDENQDTMFIIDSLGGVYTTQLFSYIITGTLENISYGNYIAIQIFDKK